ncbi:MAG: phosphoribosylformylglycinamidine cyclo-ligase [Nitrospirota bacterium]
MAEITYKDSGVDIEAGEKFVESIRSEVRSTFRPEVLTDIGGFGGLFNLDRERYREPVLVSATDGVGTKLRIAFMMNRHDTIGIDLVAMCVNDLIVTGADPLFFLDYLSTGKLIVEKSKEIIKGIAKGCRLAGCSLIGGETAEMPSFYNKDEYDLAGFAVGVVEKSRIIDGRKIDEGDRIIALPSSGLHSNGYSLVRKIIFEKMGLGISERIGGLDKEIGEELLVPTRIYVKTISGLINRFELKGIAHITGGGLTENIPRIIPDGFEAIIDRGKVKVHPVFRFIQKNVDISIEELYRTFNMGVGMVIIASFQEAEKIVSACKEFGDDAYIIGEIKKGEKRVRYV